MTDSLPTPADLRWLSGLARALLRDAHAADDLVQDTVVAALERPRPIDAPPRAWLGGVARRLALRQRRGDLRRGDREWLVARSEALPDSSELVERLDSAERLTAAVRSLPEPYRRVLLLRFLDDREPSWIAECDGAPVDTVRRRIRRGLELLREDLDRDARLRGSSWSVLLLPLAREGAEATPALAGGSLTSVTSMTTLKLTLLALAALLGGGGFLFLTQEDPAAADAVRSTAEVRPLEADVDSVLPTATRTAEAGAVDAAGASRTAVESSAAPSEPLLVFTPQATQGLHGVVLDDRGAPVEGALVYALASEVPDPEEEESEVRFALQTLGYLDDVTEPDIARTFTDGSGRFFLPEDDLPEIEDGYELVLGAHHNGFLRAVVPNPRARQTAEGLQVRLERGRTLRGRLIDETGLPVGGAALIAFKADGAWRSESPSTLRLESEKKQMADRTSSYFDCQVVTDANGEFTLSGIPGDALIVASLEPDLAVVDPPQAGWSEGFVEFTAEHCLGVRVSISDAPTETVGPLWLTVHLTATFEDGTSKLFRMGAQGDGVVDFRLHPKFLPGQTDAAWRGQRIVQADLNGVATIGRLSADWNAEPVVDVTGVTGIVEAAVPFSHLDGIASPHGESPFGEVLASLLVLDLRHPDGTPVTGRVAGRWTSTDVGREPISQTFRGRPERPGYFPLTVPEGELEVVVESLDDVALALRMTGRRQCSWGNRSDLSLSVAAPASATLVRPEGWAGEWHVEASYRIDSKGTWRGAWTYATSDSSLTLRGLLPHEWRFQLRRSVEGAPEEERSVKLRAGEQALVR